MTTSTSSDNVEVGPRGSDPRLHKENPVILFTLNGVRHELASATVLDRLAETPPEDIAKHAVRVNDIWYPVMQAFEAATGIPRAEFKSRVARRHLAILGYEIRGEISPPASVTTEESATSPLCGPPPDGSPSALS